MNKKAKKRIFDKVMATMPEHCQTPWFRHNTKKLILLITKSKYNTLTEEEIIRDLSHDEEDSKRWRRTPEQLEEDIKLEQSVGLMCGNPNA